MRKLKPVKDHDELMKLIELAHKENDTLIQQFLWMLTLPNEATVERARQQIKKLCMKAAIENQLRQAQPNPIYVEAEDRIVIGYYE